MSAVAIDWCRKTSMGHALVVTEATNRVVVYDTRKLAPKGSKAAAAVLHVSEPRSKERIETTIFGPGSGRLLISASQLYDVDTTSDLCIWDWTKTEKREGSDTDELRFPAHTDGIYTMALSPDGMRLATGGSDATVAFWDTETMVCTHTVDSRTKYIRAVAFSRDSKVLAHSTEEDHVALVNADDGSPIGQINLGHRRGGAENMAWHPSSPILACARIDNPGSSSHPPIAIAKLSYS